MSRSLWKCDNCNDFYYEDESCSETRGPARDIGDEYCPHCGSPMDNADEVDRDDLVREIKDLREQLMENNQ